MSELKNYYDAFQTAYWENENPDKCACHGSGWALSDVDTWHQCPIHWNEDSGHPEDYHDEEPTAAEYYGCCNPSGDDIPLSQAGGSKMYAEQMARLRKQQAEQEERERRYLDQSYNEYMEDYSPIHDPEQVTTEELQQLEFKPENTQPTVIEDDGIPF